MMRLIPPVPAVERGIPANVIAEAHGTRVYPGTNGIILENVEGNPSLIYHHQAKVTAIAVSTSGAWIASGDAKGQLKIWTSKGENLLKYDYKLLVGAVRSICWSPDSKRVAVCGGDPSKGAEAVCIAYDTGSRIGEISGHSKSIVCAAYRPVPPFRIITGSEDTSVIFHEGPPFKFMRSHQTVHTAFVNAVAFSPDGSRAFSCASDGIVAVYAGDTGDFLSKLQPKLPCSIWGLSVLGNTTSVLALACGDKKVRIFDGQSIVCETQVGTGDLQDMPLGISGRYPASSEFTTISLDGTMRTYSFSENSIELKSTIEGSNGSITSIVPNGDSGFTVSASNGTVWSVNTIDGPVEVHQTRKKPLKVSAGIARLHDQIVGISGTGTSLTVLGNSDTSCEMALDSPIRLVQASTRIFVLNNKSHTISQYKFEKARFLAGEKYDSKESVGVFAVSQSGSSVVVSTDKTSTSALNAPKKEFVLFKAGLGSTPTTVETEITSSEIVSLAVSDNGDIVAVASAGQELHVYRSGVLVQGTKNCWTYHKARITCMRWIDDQYLVTGGLDRNIYVWDPSDPAEGPVAALKDVHRDGVACFIVSRQSPTEIRIVSGGIEGSTVVNVVHIKRI